MAKIEITAEIVRELLDYAPETGVFVWRERSGVPGWWNTRFAGTAAGTRAARGYVRICIDSKTRPAHRLAWLWTHGVWVEELDHINHDRADNRIANLRPVSRSANAQNRTLGICNTSGTIGVHKEAARSVWKATITVSGKAVFLGRFSDKQQALDARKNAERLYGFHENHGKARA